MEGWRWWGRWWGLGLGLGLGLVPSGTRIFFPSPPQINIMLLLSHLQYKWKEPLIFFEELEAPKSLAATLALKRLDCKGWEAQFPAKIRCISSLIFENAPTTTFKPLDWKKRPKGFFFCWKITVEKGKEKTYIEERGDRKEKNRRKAMSAL